MVSHCGFCVSLIASQVEHFFFFDMFIGHLESFLSEIAVQVFCLNFFELCFFLFICRDSLQRVKICPFILQISFQGLRVGSSFC